MRSPLITVEGNWTQLDNNRTSHKVEKSHLLYRALGVFVSGSNKAHLKGGVLPAYCDPPNPCPKGYTAEDGCIEVEEFANEAEFSRNYQAAQSCMCDSEHMFTCPQDNSFSQVYGDSQVRSPPPPLAVINIIHPIQDGGFSLFGLPELTNIDNPFLSGSKLPIAAKKGLGY